MTQIYTSNSSPIFNDISSILSNTKITKVNLETQPDTFVSSKKDKKDTAKKVAIGVGIAAGIIALAAIIKNKKLPKSVKLQNIKFDKGIANTVDGNKFTGIVKDTLKSGDKVTLEYVDGVIKHSKVSGSRNFEKTFETNEAGHKIVKTIKDGAEKVIDITQKQADVLADQTKLDKLLKDTTLSSKELSKQANEINFKSKNQQKQIENIVENKKTAEQKAKIEAEKLAQEKAKAEAEKLAQEKAKAEAEKAAQVAHFENKVKNDIEKSKIINSKVDKIMQQPDYDEKIEQLLNTEITVLKSKYDSTMEKTTINKIMDGTIKGEYQGKIPTIYHGTTENLKNEIVKNGFSTDACGITESGKGIYFALDKLGCESLYGQGGLITAEYTGKKVAEIEPGVMGDLYCNLPVRRLFKNIFGHEFMTSESDAINREIINRIYTKKLSDLGYGALHVPYSHGAKCEYVTILDPKNIKIIK